MEKQKLENPKYPVGISSFPEIRENGYVYVDKTEDVYNIVSSDAKYVFINRPPRFGKTLLVSTIEAYFQGRKDLFKGLAIEKLETEWVQYPVLRFDLSAAANVADRAELEGVLNAQLAVYETKYGCENDDKYPNFRLMDLVRNVRKKTGKRAVLLIDAYDAPVLDLDSKSETFEQLWHGMLNFFAPIKSLCGDLEFFFMTGVSRFAASMLSGILNNLDHIETDKKYASVCGITREEMETQLREHIKRFGRVSLFDEAVSALCENYGGYRFTFPSPEICNPYSLMKALDIGKIDSYWADSVLTPTFYEKLMGYGVPSCLANEISVWDLFLNEPLETTSTAYSFLYQRGFLTVKDYDQEFTGYTTGKVNKEVRVGLMKFLLGKYVSPSQREEALDIFAKMSWLL